MKQNIQLKIAKDIRKIEMTEHNEDILKRIGQTTIGEKHKARTNFLAKAESWRNR